MKLTKSAPAPVTPPVTYTVELSQRELDVLTIVLGGCGGGKYTMHDETTNIRDLLLDHCTLDTDERLGYYNGSLRFIK